MSDTLKDQLNKPRKELIINDPVTEADLDSAVPVPPKTNLLHSLDEKPVMKKSRVNKGPLPLVVGALVIVIAGTLTGFGLNQVTSSGSSSVSTNVDTSTGQVDSSEIAVGTTWGKESPAGDSAEGVLEAGGINGEGSHKLLRAGGPSQTVYLTSSVVSLDQFVGHKVEVWGDTFAAQTAGWLMDVTSLKVTELNADKPFAD